MSTVHARPTANGRSEPLGGEEMTQSENATNPRAEAGATASSSGGVR